MDSNETMRKKMASSIILEDLEFISKKVYDDKYFNDSIILVTGATGLIGSLIVKSILYANKTLRANIKVLASVRNLDKAKQIFSEYSNIDNLEFILDDLMKPLEFLDTIDFIIHTASITASREMVENPTGVLLTAFESTRNLLDYLKLNPKCKMLYLSSMEYYGQVLEENNNVTEDKLGYIDLSKPRSCYPESKRVCESLCNAYVAQYNVHVCSARLAQTFGAGVSFDDNRVFAQFAKSALSHSDIILHTAGLSEGNYCYTADAIYGILLLLKKGEKGQSYNIAVNHSSIFNMAKMLAEKICNNKINIKIDIPSNLDSLGYAPDVKLKLNANKLRALGWEPIVDFENMFRRMIKSWEFDRKYE